MRSTNDIHEGVPAWPRITELARVIATALSAVMVCFPMFLASRPRTPLRVLCIAAFEYLARMRGGTLGRQRRSAMAHACDFGSLRNEYYDRRKLDGTEYQSLRRQLRHMAPRPATSHYIRQLRQAERNRPDISACRTTSMPGLPDAVMAYRTSVLDLSLRWFQSIGSVRIESGTFHAFLSVASLCQIADDLLDWKDDLAQKRPSYVTAFLADRTPTAVVTPLRAEADALLQRTFATARQDVGTLPFAVAAAVTWTLVIALLRVRLPR